MKSHILILGGEKGSWQVRGQQIGAALGATITTQPRRCDWIWADVVICVKQAMERFHEDIQRRHLPVIWDVLDYWKQPEDNARTASECLADFRQRCARYRPSILIGATRAMASAIGGFYIPHHSRPGLIRQPMRRELRTVAYEGRQKYLGAWLGPLQATCDRLGAQFVINPRSLTDADVVVSLRGDHWDGWACREWKSGVKYINALVAGRPVVTQRSAAFDEIRPTGVTIETPAELEQAIQAAWRLAPAAYAQAEVRAGEFSLDTIVQQYRLLVRSALRVAA